jgi:DmsE family decaheme c-type cytochrome
MEDGHRMRIRDGFVRLPSIIMLALIVAAGSISSSTEAQDKKNNGLPEAQYTAEGTERCLKCHAGETMTIVAETAHGNADNPHTPYAQKGCESCHGPGSLHVSRARGGIGFPAMVVFDKRDTVERQTDACLGCHAEDMGDLEGMAWNGSAHDTGRMTCISCHDGHVVGNPLGDQAQQRKACAKCHEEEIAGHPRFEDKGIVFDQLNCFDCHDVHQLEREP